MHILIVHAHPEPQSFNGAMTRTATAALQAAGHQVSVSDLYQMGFDPVSDRSNFTTVADPAFFKPQVEEVHATKVDGFIDVIESELQKLESADLIIFQFPLWWFGLPAILKGWVDRVFAMGRTYGGGRAYDTGVFRGKKGIVSMTAGASAEDMEPNNPEGEQAKLLFPIENGIFGFVGIEALPAQVVYGPARMTHEQRTAELEKWAARLQKVGEE